MNTGFKESVEIIMLGEKDRLDPVAMPNTGTL